MKEDQKELYDVVVDYTYALDTLDDYDYQRLGIRNTTNDVKFHATYENAMEAIQTLRDKFGGSDADDCRKQDGREGCDGKSRG